MKICLLLSFLLFAGCNSKEKSAFEGLEDGGADPTPIVNPVVISSFTPILDPLVATATSSVVYSVNTVSGSGEIAYVFELDGTQSLKSGIESFYILQGSTLGAGTHKLKVIASNSSSSATKEFNIRKNTPTSIPVWTPVSLTGNSISCTTGLFTASGFMVEYDLMDVYSATWEIDGVPVTQATSFTTVSTVPPQSQLSYAPDCTQVGQHTVSLKVFDGFETTTKSWSLTVGNPPPLPGNVQISSFLPTLDPVIMVTGVSETFSVEVFPGAGAVTFDFILDNSSTIQSGNSSFKSLSGSALTPGYHSLKVRAQNAVSTVEKTFNLRKNTPPSFGMVTPALTGANVNCGTASITFDAAYSDVDADTLTKSWQIDGASVTGATSFISTSDVLGNPGSSRLIYSPDCTQSGAHTLQLKVSDGHEEVVKSWTFQVTNPPAPPGVVQIVSYTPTVTPVVLTSASSTTFAVAINDGAGSVSYEFKKDFSTVLQMSDVPFYVLNGASLSPGIHTLKVKGTNSVSTDEKIFNIRKNSPSSVVSFSPVLSGASMNCGQDTLTFNAAISDIDSDAFTMSWELDSAAVTGSTPFTVITNNAPNARLAYTPDCSRAGFHTLSLKINDGYEVTTQTWSFNVVNPAVETITTYFPSSNSLTLLSSEASKVFSAVGSGIGALTFTWKLDGTVVKTDSNVTASNLSLLWSGLATGPHTLLLTLTDSTTTNDPSLPVTQSWSIYRNQKPSILSPVPSAPEKINISSGLLISATIQDAQDTVTTRLSKGALDCNPLSECGLTSLNLPTVTGTMSAQFSPNTTFLGDNQFTLTVTDSKGETTSQVFDVSVNYFSTACNQLTPGKICTLVGLPGLGSGLNTITDANKVRVTPAWVIPDDQGNYFFSDHSSHTVWYQNTKATPVTILNQTVPPHSIYVVAGTGVVGAGGNGQQAKKFALNFNVYGGGLAWDSDRKELYIADYSNNRVVKVATDGRANIVCGGSNQTFQGAMAKDSACGGPVDLEFDSANRRLYISQQSNYIIKYVDATNLNYTLWPSYILAGVYPNPNSVSTNGSSNMTAFPGSFAAGSSRLQQPWGLALDKEDGILYFTEYGPCRIRAIGLPGGNSKTIFGQSITPGTVVSITNAGACTASPTNTNSPLPTVGFGRPYDLLLHKSGASVLGMYVSDTGGNRVTYINNSVSPVTIGNQVINPQSMNNVFGNGNTSPTNPPSGKNSSVLSPIGLVFSGSSLLVGAKGNSMINSLNTSNPDGIVTTFLGGNPRAGYSGNSALDSKLVTFNNPLSLLFRPSSNQVFVSDSQDFMIRAINLTSGKVEDFIGTGQNAVETNLNTITTSTRMASPRGMGFLDNFFLYADSNNNCYVRAYNPETSDQSIFGTLVFQNRTSVVAGYFNNCGNYTGTPPQNTNAINAKLNQPYGIGVHQASRTMYVSSSSSHCILKVTDSGTMEPFIGTCGVPGAANTPVYGGSYVDPSLLLRSPAEIYMDTAPGNEGNFFFTDYTDASTAHVKYVNLVNATPVVFPGGITVARNVVETVFAATSSPGFIRSITGYEDWICYTSGGISTGQGNNTVICRNRVNSATKVFGVAGEGGISHEGSDEGALIDDGASTVIFAIPSGLAFDGEGNLLISEQAGHVIRMIKKWW